MITILIPTYNRPGYLKRILGYYNDFRVAYNIIIADGSSDEIKKVNKETVSSFPSLRIQHLAKYSSETHPLQRFNDALKYINTDYCLFCADDDFVTPNGISQSADFLEKNPDFAVAHGRYISFYLKDDERGKQRFYWKPTYSHESITLSDPAMRISCHLPDYSQNTFYAVHRTDLLQMIWAENVRFMNDARFSELLPSMLTLIYGKLKCLDVLYAAREAIPHSAGRRSKILPDFMRDGTYDEKYAKFRECLSTHLSEQSQLNMEESKTLIDNAMAAYMKKYYGYNYKVLLLLHKAEYVLGHVPRPIDKYIRALYRKLFLPKQNTNLPISHINNDLNKIRLCVLSYGNINEMIDASAKRSKGAI